MRNGDHAGKGLVAQSAVGYAHGVLEGWINWADDALFRPTIAIFKDDALLRTVPTWRAPSNEPDRASWFVCRFKASGLDIETLTQSALISVSCLELGVVLHRFEPRSTREKISGMLDIDQIISMGQSARRPWKASGFLAFLQLPVIDQLHILYSDLLGATGDASGTAMYFEEIRSGRMTILDVRDAMVDSEDFLRRTRASIDERVGGWCVWEGLAEDGAGLILPRGAQPVHDLTPPSVSIFSRYLDVVSAVEELELHLQKLTLPPDVFDAVKMVWSAHNAGLIRLLEENVVAITRRHEAPRPPRQVLAMIRDLLPSMEVGDAGLLVGARVRSHVGAEGRVVFGPYIRLLAGSYRVTALVTVNIPDTSSEVDVGYSLEVVSGTILFGHVAFAANNPGPGCCVLDFAIPDGDPPLLSDARYEIRIAVAGPVGLEVESITMETPVQTAASVYPSVKDWLALMSVGSAGQRLAGGKVCSRVNEMGGHVLYGPYVTLLPGSYTLIADIAPEENQAREFRVMVEVVAPSFLPLASREFHLRTGRCRLLVPFTIERPAALERLSGPLEFRIASDGTTRFLINSLDILPNPAPEIDTNAPDAEPETENEARVPPGQEPNLLKDSPTERRQAVGSNFYSRLRRLVRRS